MNPETGAPNQDRNAGNAGDVWKHRTLLALANLLLEAHPPDRPFRYFESHAGKGIYKLSSSKGAGRGVYSAIDRLGQSDPYVMAEQEAVARGEYLGSWKLVANLLSSKRLRGHIQLCDTDPSVLAEIQRNGDAAQPVHLHAGDGFAAAKGSDADLLLTDPFASWAQSARVATALSERNLLVWYGIVANGQPNQLVKKTGLLGFEVLWSQIHENHSPTQRGCGLLLSRPLQRFIPRLLTDSYEAATKLGWELHLRQPRAVPSGQAEGGERAGEVDDPLDNLSYEAHTPPPFSEN